MLIILYLIYNTIRILFKYVTFILFANLNFSKFLFTENVYYLPWNLLLLKYSLILQKSLIQGSWIVNLYVEIH